MCTWLGPLWGRLFKETEQNKYIDPKNHVPGEKSMNGRRWVFSTTTLSVSKKIVGKIRNKEEE